MEGKGKDNGAGGWRVGKEAQMQPPHVLISAGMRLKGSSHKCTFQQQQQRPLGFQEDSDGTISIFQALEAARETGQSNVGQQKIFGQSRAEAIGKLSLLALPVLMRL